MFDTLSQRCVYLICSVVVLIVQVWAVVGLQRFNQYHSMSNQLAPPMPKQSTLESGHHHSQETRAHKHLLRSALSPHLKKHGRRFPRSQASNPCRVQDGRRILCRLHSVSSIVSAVAPRRSQHQRLHPPQFGIKTSFTIVQGCGTSSTNNDGESFEQRKRVCPKYARNVRALCPMTTCFRRQMS